MLKAGMRAATAPAVGGGLPSKPRLIADQLAIEHNTTTDEYQFGPVLTSSGPSPFMHTEPASVGMKRPWGSLSVNNKSVAEESVHDYHAYNAADLDRLKKPLRSLSEALKGHLTLPESTGHTCFDPHWENCAAGLTQLTEVCFQVVCVSGHLAAVR